MRPRRFSRWPVRCSRRRPGKVSARASEIMISSPPSKDALNAEQFDEVIVSTLPKRVSRWLHLDLPSKVAGLGLPVTTVSAKGRET